MTLESFKPFNASICTKSFIFITRSINAYTTMRFTIIAIVTTGAFWNIETNSMTLTATKIKTNNTNLSSLLKPCLQVQQHNCLLFYPLTLVSEHSYTASTCEIVQKRNNHISWDFVSNLTMGIPETRCVHTNLTFTFLFLNVNVDIEHTCTTCTAFISTLTSTHMTCTLFRIARLVDTVTISSTFITKCSRSTCYKKSKGIWGILSMIRMDINIY